MTYLNPRLAGSSRGGSLTETQMTDSKDKPMFTPGPWKFEIEGLVWVVCADAEPLVAAAYNEANAHIISAAVDMFEALKAALPHVERIAATAPFDQHRKMRQLQAVKDAAAIRAALAKARGQ